ncbi:hypothetical protein HD806DRAFT_499614 [Xylariaceae sp. AK1471]|nr:hypothetical protein HD806DRAFT_499614 [Xylariaceae sp. AK1471]
MTCLINDKGMDQNLEDRKGGMVLIYGIVSPHTTKQCIIHVVTLRADVNKTIYVRDQH